MLPKLYKYFIVLLFFLLSFTNRGININNKSHQNINNEIIRHDQKTDKVHIGDIKVASNAIIELQPNELPVIAYLYRKEDNEPRKEIIE